ncbi:MAG TPA: ATP-binding protein [Clostridia bacterium]|nr:ATP-binding protein [Clostridia bacterium]
MKEDAGTDISSDDVFSEMAAETVEPRASALIESLRAFGYTTKTAVADLIDNSITAGARSVHVSFDWSGADSSIAVSDDGSGMDIDTLIEAMRLGTLGPSVVRRPDDLGRFGLGLKTASFSQCRRVTVASQVESTKPVLRAWDLDHVVATNRWELLKTPTRGAEAVISRSLAVGHGTCVVWEKLDQILSTTGTDNRQGYDRFLVLAEQVKEHLAMVFHRFLEGKDLSLEVNGNRIEPWDPYMAGHPGTQHLCSEALDFMGSTIHVDAYVLPHESRLTEEAHRRGGGPGGWNAQQGFYVYRGHRLLVAGDWLGLGTADGTTSYRKEEHYKLARIMVDIPTVLDKYWGIDVKKSTARPPADVRQDFQRIATATRSHAVDVYRHRGKVIQRGVAPEDCVWLESVVSGRSSFVINRQHPFVGILRDESPHVRQITDALLELVEGTYPTKLVLLRNSEQQNVKEPLEELLTQSKAASLGRVLHESLMTRLGITSEQAWERLERLEPFNSQPEALLAAKRQEKGG